MRPLPLIKFENGLHFCDRGDDCVLKNSGNTFFVFKNVTAGHPNVGVWGIWEEGWWEGGGDGWEGGGQGVRRQGAACQDPTNQLSALSSTLC